MKTIKILTIGLACAFALASCQPKPVTASGDATVGFAAAEYESGLGSQYIYVPIVTTGETTVYPIKVNIEVGEYTGDFAATEDVDYMITSKEILVASAQSSPSVEIKILNPSDADALNFRLVITSQDNAQSISQAEVLVRCEKSFLDRICGRWNVSGAIRGEAYSEVWTISNSLGQAAISGIFGESGAILGTVDEEARTITFIIGEGSNNMIGAYNFTGIGPAYVAPVRGYDGYTSDGRVGCGISGEPLVGTISEDFRTITWNMDPSMGLYGEGLVEGVFSYDDVQEYLGYYQAPLVITNNTITKQ